MKMLKVNAANLLKRVSLTLSDLGEQVKMTHLSVSKCRKIKLESRKMPLPWNLGSCLRIVTRKLEKLWDISLDEKKVNILTS